MANHRMFSQRICESARFLQMPPSTQNLYFHLGLHADDDGVVEAFPVLRIVNATEDDLRILVAKKFVIILNEDLITYICDWAENNKIRADRKIDSIYQELLLQIVPDAPIVQRKQRADRKNKGQRLQIADQHKAGCSTVECVETKLKTCNQLEYKGDSSQNARYSETENLGRPMDADGRRKTRQDKLSKDKLSCLSSLQQHGKSSTVETVENSKSTDSSLIEQSVLVEPPTLQEVVTFSNSVKSDVDPYRFYDYYNQRGWTTKAGEPIRNWRNLFRSWNIHEGIFQTDTKNQKQSDSGVDYSQFVYNIDK